MQRYNPPSTSAQSYCIGCIRQIRKVNSVLREQYLADVNHQVEQNNLLVTIRDLERKLEAEKSQKNALKIMLSKTRNPEQINEQVQELLKVNERLTEEIQKVKEIPATLPFQEWKQGFEENWNTRYEELKEFAIELQDDAGYYKKKEHAQRDVVEQQKKEIARLKKLVLEKEELIDILRGDDYESSNGDEEEEEEEEKIVEVNMDTNSSAV